MASILIAEMLLAEILSLMQTAFESSHSGGIVLTEMAAVVPEALAMILVNNTSQLSCAY